MFLLKVDFYRNHYLISRIILNWIPRKNRITDSIIYDTTNGQTKRLDFWRRSAFEIALIFLVLVLKYLRDDFLFIEFSSFENRKMNRTIQVNSGQTLLFLFWQKFIYIMNRSYYRRKETRCAYIIASINLQLASYVYIITPLDIYEISILHAAIKSLLNR